MNGKTALVLAALLCGTGSYASAQAKPGGEVVSRGLIVDLAAKRVPEKATVFVFYRPDSTLEQGFVEGLRQHTGEKVALRLVPLKTGAEPITKKYEVAATPSALVYDRRGRLTGRSSDPAEIHAAITKAAGVMRIDWAADDDPRLAEAARRLGRPVRGGILRTMTQQPEYLQFINDLSRKAHFSDGFLDRRTKEMIATYVSTLNKCKY